MSNFSEDQQMPNAPEDPIAQIFNVKAVDPFLKAHDIAMHFPRLYAPHDHEEPSDLAFDECDKLSGIDKPYAPLGHEEPSNLALSDEDKPSHPKKGPYPKRKPKPKDTTTSPPGPPSAPGQGPIRTNATRSGARRPGRKPNKAGFSPKATRFCILLRHYVGLSLKDIASAANFEFGYQEDDKGFLTSQKVSRRLLICESESDDEREFGEYWRIVEGAGKEKGRAAPGKVGVMKGLGGQTLVGFEGLNKKEAEEVRGWLGRWEKEKK